jgi:TetR/AcrR family transcriptional regulator, transcriptional repressor for nem operon
MLAQAEQKERSHRKILAFASRFIRERGARASSVEDVMGAAGLTRGGFYAHFRDKSALIVECLDVAFAEARRNLLLGEGTSVRGRAWLEHATRRYLSRAHLEAPGEGCAIPALGGEIGRGDEALRDAFTRNIQALLGDIEQRLATASRPARRRAISTLALWVGGLMIARAVNNPELADEILETCRSEILGAKRHG